MSEKLPENRLIPIIAGFAILWSLMGLAMFFLSLGMTEANLETGGYNSAQISYILATPAWAKVSNFIAVAASFVGSIFLFLRRKPAYYLYALSLMAILIVMLDAYVRNGFQIIGGANNVVSLAVIVIGIFLFWFTNNANVKGQLR